MNYISNNYNDFKDFYSFWANINKLFEQEFGHFDLDKYKINKSNIEKTYLSTTTENIMSSDTLSTVEQLLSQIVFHLNNNNFETSYLPLSTINANNKTGFNQLLFDGLTQKTQKLSDAQKISVWAEAVAYMYHCMAQEKSVKISIDEPSKIEISNFYLKLKESFKSHDDLPLQLQIEKPNYNKNIENEKSKYTNDFHWFIDNTLIFNNWGDEQYCLKQLETKFSDIEFVEQSILEKPSFQMSALNHLLKMNLASSRYDTDYHNDSYKVLADTPERYMYYLDILLSNFKQADVNNDNVNSLFSLLKYIKKNIKEDNKNIKNKIHNLITNYLNNTITKEQFNTLSSSHSLIALLNKETLKKDYVIKALCDNFIMTSNGNRNYYGRLNDFFEPILNKYPDILDKELFLNVLMHFKKENNMALAQYNNIYKNILSIIKTLDETQLLQALAFNKNIAKLLSHTTRDEKIQINIGFPITDTFLESLYNILASTDDLRAYFYLITPEYLDKNFKTVVQRSGYSRQYLNEANFSKYIQNDDIHFIVDMLQKEIPDFLQDFKHPCFYKDGRLNIEIIKNIPYKKIYSEHHYGKTRSPIKSFFNSITDKEKKALLLADPLFYDLLPEIKKIDKMAALNYLTSGGSDKLSQISSIPKLLFSDADFCLDILKLCFTEPRSKKYFLNKIPTERWSNKYFILNACKIFDKHSDNTINDVIALLPKNIIEFMKKFEISTGNYYDFMSSYITKQELKNMLSCVEPEKQLKKVNKL